MKLKIMLNNEEQLLLKKVEELFFKDSPIKIAESLEGQSVHNGLSLGLRAGPSCLVSNLTHEMSHLAEIDQSRILLPNWGLKYGQAQEILGRVYYEFSTTQATEREIRVFAYQQNLHNFLGIKSTPQEFSKLGEYLGDFAVVAYGDKLNLKSREKATQWIESQIIEKMKTFTLEKFMSEWNNKNQLLNQKIRNGEFK